MLGAEPATKSDDGVRHCAVWRISGAQSVSDTPSEAADGGAAVVGIWTRRRTGEGVRVGTMPIVLAPTSPATLPCTTAQAGK